MTFRYMKGVPFFIKRYTKRVQFLAKWYIKGQGVRARGGASPNKTFLGTPRAFFVLLVVRGLGMTAADFWSREENSLQQQNMAEDGSSKMYR